MADAGLAPTNAQGIIARPAARTPSRQSQSPSPAAAVPPSEPTPDQTTLSRGAVQQRLGQEAGAAIFGAADGVLNKAEMVSLANHQQRTQQLLNQFGQGPLTADQQTQLQGRLNEFDNLNQRYRSEDVSPEPGGTLQTPRQAMDSWGFAQGADQLRGANRPWNSSEKAMYRLYTSPDQTIRDAPAPSTGSAAPPSQPLPAHPILSQALDRDFNTWDHDHRGVLTRQDLVQAMQDPSIKGEDAVALMTLRRNQHDMESFHPGQGGITREDVQAFQAGNTSNPAVKNVSRTFEWERRQALPPAGPLAQESFDARQIRQGSDGTCILLTTMHGMKPEDLRKMVTDNGNGTYTVNFADGRSATVNEPTEAQRRYYSQGPNGERWPAIMEMGARDVLGRNPAPGYDPDGSVPVDEAYRMVTGRPSQKLMLESDAGGANPAVSYPEFRQRLQEGLARGPVIAGTENNEGLPAGLQQRESLRNGLLNGHEYAVLGFDPQTNTVTLRNPHGHGEYQPRFDGVDDGTFRMPADELYANFYHLVVPQ